MFTMSLLCCMLIFSVFTVTCHALPVTTKLSDTPSKQPCSQTMTSEEIQELKLQISQHDTRINKLIQKIEQQNTAISQQNTRFAKLNTRIEQQNTKVADQNTKFADQNTKFADQNTKLSEQTNKILQQNNKMKEMEMKIEDLEKEGNQENQPPSRNSILTNFTIQNTKLSEQILKQNSKIRNLKMEIEDSRQNQPSPRNNLETGSIFTRWGRRDCPRNVSQLVYSGITGGSRFDHYGGAAEYVCLPPDPSWNQNKHYKGSYWGYMYGTEYQDIPKAIGNYKVPCAVCRTSLLSTVVMIPARSEYYPGWQEAYHGELVSGYHGHRAASQYVCLDDDPQTNGTNSDNEGKLMYAVRTRCGALPCPPYEDNTLLTCVVCLK